MGELRENEPALLLLAAFSRSEEALAWAEQKATAAWGPVALASESFAFEETDYYAASMGENLRKRFWVFQNLIQQGMLAELKRCTNQWEQEYAAAGSHDVDRPLNLDPGYITRGKLVLASTKDHAHRIYLSDGIFAEVTLYYKDKQWQLRPWTFEDYRRADYHAFFDRCREYLQNKLREE